MSTSATPTAEARQPLLNKTELAELLNVDRKFITAMCHHAANPFRFALGGRTTHADAIAWLRANPTFKGIASYRSQAKPKPRQKRTRTLA